MQCWWFFPKSPPEYWFQARLSEVHNRKACAEELMYLKNKGLANLYIFSQKKWVTLLMFGVIALL